MVVVFDVDGTLFDTKDQIVQCMNKVLSRSGYPTIDDVEAKRFVGPPFLDTLPAYKGVDPRDVTRIVQTFREEYEHVLLESPLYPGASDVLCDLKRAGAILGIATNKPRNQVVALLAREGLMDAFDYIFTSTDGLEKVEMLMRIDSATQSCGPKIMVGDTEQDYLAAKKAGYIFGWASYGYGWLSYPDVRSVSSIRNLITSINDFLL